MDLQSLEAFCVVYEQGTVSKAAKKLFMSQQGLSKTIIRLEKELGRPLFQRSNRGVEPTEFAHTLYPKAGKMAAILRSIDTAEQELPQREELLIATTTGFLMSVGLEFINDFERAHSGIELRIEECSDLHVAEKVDSGAAEIGFLSGPIDYEKHNGTLFLRHRHVVVVNQLDELSHKERLSWSDLEGKTIALMSRSHAPYSAVLTQMLKADAIPKKLIETSEGYVGFDLAANNQAICISTDLHASIWARGPVQIVPIYDDYHSWDVSLITGKGEPLSESAQAFLEFAPAWIMEHRNERFSWEHTIW